MKLIRSLAFGAMAIMAATFSSVASAKADNVGVYIGSDGFGLQFSSHDRGYYGGNYYGGGHYGPANYYHRGYQDRCRNKHYRRTHRHCWNGAHNYHGGYKHGGYKYGYQPNHYYGYGHYPRARHAYKHRKWGNQQHWRDRHDRWRDHRDWRSRGHEGRGKWRDGGRGHGHGHYGWRH
jgi:hypothetical protein